MSHNIQLFPGSNPMTWRNAREAQAHHQKTCKYFCICSQEALLGEKKSASKKLKSISCRRETSLANVLPRANQIK